MKLTEEEKRYFEDKKVWGYGPCYNLTLCTEREHSSEEVSKTLLQKSALTLWKGSAKELPLFTAMKKPGAPPLGFIHTYVYRPELRFSSYQLSIYPEQFERYVGSAPYERPFEMDTKRFRLLHDELFDLVKVVAELHPVFCATIHDETYGFVSEIDNGFGVYMLKEYAELLNIETDALARVRSFEFVKL